MSAGITRGEAVALALAALVVGPLLWEARETVRFGLAIYAVALGWGA